jgi:K+ transporter
MRTRAFAVFSAIYALAIVYYSTSGFAFYGAGLMLPTLVFVPLGLFFVRSRGLLSWTTIFGKISFVLVFASMLFCLTGIGVTIFQENSIERHNVPEGFTP